jgi:hypothetical protein
MVQLDAETFEGGNDFLVADAYFAFSKLMLIDTYAHFPKTSQLVIRSVRR